MFFVLVMEIFMDFQFLHIFLYLLYPLGNQVVLAMYQQKYDSDLLL